MIDSHVEEAQRLHKELEELKGQFLELVKLQEHYAGLLNAHDGGRRRRFHSPVASVQRLIDTLPAKEKRK